MCCIAGATGRWNWLRFRSPLLQRFFREGRTASPDRREKRADQERSPSSNSEIVLLLPHLMQRIPTEQTCALSVDWPRVARFLFPYTGAGYTVGQFPNPYRNETEAGHDGCRFSFSRMRSPLCIAYDAPCSRVRRMESLSKRIVSRGWTPCFRIRRREKMG